MTQVASYAIANDSGAAVRAQVNQVLEALRSLNAGPSPPPATAPGMLWLDTAPAPPVLKIRNTADSDWRELLDGGAY